MNTMKTRRALSGILATAGLCAACGGEAGGGASTGDVNVGATSEALSDELVLPAVPGIAAPAGYGTYCSVNDHGGWAFQASGPGGDPCGELAGKVGASAVIRRAGLWSVSGNNNAMARCDGGILSVRRGTGSDPINGVFNDANNVHGQNCIITVSPTRLPTFGFPYDASSPVTYTTVFGYDLAGTQAPWNLADFGRFPGVPVCEVDRTGYGSHSCTTDAQGNLGPAPWQTYVAPHSSIEPAYDWSMARDTPILAVADGIVRGAQARPTGIPGETLQLELFIETQVGTGRYAEHFVAAYHHMEPSPLTPPPSNINAITAIAQHVNTWNAQWAAQGKPAIALPPPGTVVKKGDVVGYIGTSGNSSGYHLDFSVFRLTNITGARAYAFKALMNATGVNGSQGIIDPFGWAAPAGIDPIAYRLLGIPTNDPDQIVADRGAFSVDLWQTPAPDGWPASTQWPLWPPTNGGPSF